MDIYNHFTQKLVDFCHKHSVKSICDYGCGDGKLLTLLKEKLGQDVRYMGVDRFEHMKQFGMEMPKLEGITFLDRDNDSFSSVKVDLAISLHAFHHYEFPIKELRTLKKMVGERGVVYIADFNTTDRDDYMPRAISSLISESFAAVRGKYHRHPYTFDQAMDLIGGVFENIVDTSTFDFDCPKSELEEERTHRLEMIEVFNSKLPEMDRTELTKDYLKHLLDFQKKITENHETPYDSYFVVVGR